MARYFIEGKFITKTVINDRFSVEIWIINNRVITTVWDEDNFRHERGTRIKDFDPAYWKDHTIYGTR